MRREPFTADVSVEIAQLIDNLAVRAAAWGWTRAEVVEHALYFGLPHLKQTVEGMERGARELKRAMDAQLAAAQKL